MSENSLRPVKNRNLKRNSDHFRFDRTVKFFSGRALTSNSVSEIQFNFLAFWSIQKKPITGVLQNKCFSKFCKTHRKTPVPESHF